MLKQITNVLARLALASGVMSKVRKNRHLHANSHTAKSNHITVVDLTHTATKCIQNLGTLVCGGISYKQVLSYHMILFLYIRGILRYVMPVPAMHLSNLPPIRETLNVTAQYIQDTFILSAKFEADTKTPFVHGCLVLKSPILHAIGVRRYL